MKRILKLLKAISNKMKLSEASQPFFTDINEEEMYFISDIEHFTKEILQIIKKEIKERKIKLVVLAGDILSFLTKYSEFIKLFEDYSLPILDLFYNTSKIKDVNKFHISREAIGEQISDYISKDIKKNKGIKNSVKYFKEFLNFCKTNKINVLYYSGNHDFLMDGERIRYLSDQMPILKDLFDFDHVYIPYNDLELIQLNKDLFVMGLHTHSDETNCNEYPKIREFVNSLKSIENPEKIIFVSHIPGKFKFSKLGSEEITLLKKRFKFKYHYHGHCKNYHDEYLEEGVPTRSVHFNDDLSNASD